MRSRYLVLLALLAVAAAPVFAADQAARAPRQADVIRPQAVAKAVLIDQGMVDGKHQLTLRFDGSECPAFGVWLDFPVMGEANAKDVEVTPLVDSKDYTIVWKAEELDNGGIEVRIGVLSMMISGKTLLPIPNGTELVVIRLPEAVNVEGVSVVPERTSASDMTAKDIPLGVYLQ